MTIISHICLMFQAVLRQVKLLKKQKKNITEALFMHLRGLAEDELPLPKPKAKADYVATS